MTNNPYTREVKVSIVEIVPDRELLPDCNAVQVNNTTMCPNKARFLVDGEPACGVHAGKPNVIFYNRARRSHR